MTDPLVRTSTGRKPLSQCGDLFIVKTECLNCGSSIYETCNTAIGPICDECLKTRKPAKRGK